MAIVHFYEKPGCLNNTKQKKLLSAAGHLLIVHDLLTEPWAIDKARLRSFFGNLPVCDWFNRSAPAIKNGHVIPESIKESQAIELMVADPLLIRRPLLEVEGRRRVGFDPQTIESWLGLDSEHLSENLETCPKQHTKQACQP